MYFQQFFIPGLAHCSYLLAGQRECLIVDPSRDIDRYLTAAAALGRPITGIIETHLHADFVSGHLDLARATGATIYVPRSAQCEFTCTGVSDGESFEVDTLGIKMLETPGHTPESAVFLVSDLERGDEPIVALTGDTLLVGDVGRPDLFPDLKQQLAASLFSSLRRLAELGDHIEVYPAHGMGSLCGRSLSGKLSTTLGTERRLNYALKIADEASFAASLLSDMPEVPDHFARCSEINRRGPRLMEDMPVLRPLNPAEFARLLDHGYTVLDTRDQFCFASAHVPGSYSISMRGNISLFSGWLLPPQNPIVIVLESEADLPAVVTALRRVGLDEVVGYLEGGMTAWANAGLEIESTENISVHELSRRLDRNELLLIDTRLKSEWDSGHTPGAVHMPAPDVRRPLLEWSREHPTAVTCNTGSRSIMAASLLQRQSFTRVSNVVGGTTAWEAAGYPLVKD